MTASTPTPDPVSAPPDDYDGPLPLFAEFMNVLGDHTGTVSGVAERRTWAQMTVTELALDLPLEIRVREDGDGRLDLRGGPPTQTVPTTIFPVLHRLRVRLALEEAPEHVATTGIRKGAPDGAPADR